MEWINANKHPPTAEGTYFVYLNRSLKYGRYTALADYGFGTWLSINGSTWPGMPKPKYYMPLPEKPSRKNIKKIKE